MNAKKRVKQGLSSQEAVSSYVRAEAEALGLKSRVLRRAKFGQKSNDVVMSLGGIPVNLEVKGVDGFSRPIPFFDKSVRRRNVPPEIESLTAALIETISVGGGNLGRVMESAGYSKTFLGVIDFYRDKIDPTVGLAEDPNSASSGKLPRDMSSSDAGVTRLARKMVLDNLVSGGDNYFAIHDKKTDDVYVWHTGHGPNPLSYPKLPAVKRVVIDTYGGASMGATRIAVKLSF